MRYIARRSERERRDLFRAAAQKMGVHEAIIEKDFWVCWTLDYVFQHSRWKDSFAFKGGTSLSKAFGAIQRFSEDIDLILDWRVIGYTAEEVSAERSANAQDSFGKAADKRSAEFLAHEFAPVLRIDLSDRAGVAVDVRADQQDVLIRYPAAFSLAAIQPTLRLEIGPMAAWVPNEVRAIRPYAAEQYPDAFRQTETAVRTIVAERTFWEKATILHQEAHRSASKPLPLRYSRHYYDLYRLSRLPIRQAALRKLDPLRDVVQFKMRFYRCTWAKYEEATPGSLSLLPPSHNTPPLRKDYQSMEGLLFGRIPAFDEILAELGDLERQINGRGLEEHDASP